MSEAREKNTPKTYFVNFQINTWKYPEAKQRHALIKNGIKYYIESFDVKQATIKIKEPFPKEVVRNITYRWNDAFRTEDGNIAHGEENETFRMLIKFLRTDEEFDEMFKIMMESYDNLFEAIKITSVELVNKNGEKFDIMNENLRDTTNVSIFHMLILLWPNKRKPQEKQSRKVIM